MKRHGQGRPLAALAAAVVAVALAGCSPGSLRAHDGQEGAASATAAPHAAPSPTAACPTADGQQAPAGCAPYDGYAAMRQNERYRQRSPLPRRVQPSSETHRAHIAVVFAKALETGPIDQGNAREILAPLGYDPTSVQARGSSDGPGGLAIGISTPAGCVYGGVREKVVDLRTGGGLADGGCLEAEGH